MTLAFMSRGAMALHKLAGAYDYDAPELSTHARLERMRGAILAARRANLDERLDGELEYALHDCEVLLLLPSLVGEVAARESVGPRMARMRRVLAYHEGAFSRLNRRYWWVPFSVALAIMAYCCANDLAARLPALVP